MDIVGFCGELTKNHPNVADRLCSAAWNFADLPAPPTSALDPTTVQGCLDMLFGEDVNSPAALWLVRDPRNPVSTLLLDFIDKRIPRLLDAVFGPSRAFSLVTVQEVAESRGLLAPGLKKCLSRLVGDRIVRIVVPNLKDGRDGRDGLAAAWQPLSPNSSGTFAMPGFAIFAASHPHIARLSSQYQVIAEVISSETFDATAAAIDVGIPAYVDVKPFTHIVVRDGPASPSNVELSAKTTVEVYVNAGRPLQHPISQYLVKEATLRPLTTDPVLQVSSCLSHPPCIVELDLSCLEVPSFANGFLRNNPTLKKLNLSKTDATATSKLRSFGDDFLRDCLALEEIVGLSQHDALESIGRNFLRGSGIKKIELQIPETCLIVGEYFAADARQLERVKLHGQKRQGGTVRLRLGAFAFYECDRLAEFDLDVTDAFVELGPFFMNHCDSLKEVDLTKCEISVMPPASFYQCDALEKIVFGGSTTELEARCCAECPRLASVDFRRPLIQLGQDCFSVKPLVDENGSFVKREGARDVLKMLHIQRPQWKKVSEWKEWKDVPRFPPFMYSSA